MTSSLHVELTQFLSKQGSASDLFSTGLSHYVMFDIILRRCG